MGDYSNRFPIMTFKHYRDIIDDAQTHDLLIIKFLYNFHIFIHHMKKDELLKNMVSKSK